MLQNSILCKNFSSLSMFGRHGSCYRTFTLLATLLCLYFVTGCVSNISPKIDSETRTNIPLHEIVPDNSFHLGAGDQLSVKFYYNEELNEDLILVLPDGSISLQLIGVVNVKGKTVVEVTEELVERYRKIIKRPEITVLVRSIRERWVHVGGEVARPGQYVNRNGLNPFQAILQAGGFKQTAELGNILILRKSNDAALHYYIYDLKESLANLEKFDDFKLRDADIVFVLKSDIGNVNEFVDLYVSGIFPDWFKTFVTYEINP